jgi:hypothetical protein
MKMVKLSDGRTVSEYEAKLTIFNAYMKMHEMLGVPVKQKAQAFRGIVDMVPGWKVVGITAAALEIFKKLDYKRPPGRGELGVNRAHKYSRLHVGIKIFEEPITNFEKFWEYWEEHDQTVLATVNENYSKGQEVSAHDVPDGLFAPYGFAYKVDEAEVEFLKSL